MKTQENKTHVDMSTREQLPPAEQKALKIGQQGVFYEPQAKSYIMHLKQEERPSSCCMAAR
jgi:hypothetical protein